ncbi:MAG: alkaline phosphatase D family protein [Bacteroidetes bacterium]|nr:alkaline phosphatase D family protein [Bacteroidota bacterium]
MRLLPVLLVLVFASSRSKAQTYPERIYPDSSFAPFLHGVASGDPLTDRVIIWTKISKPQQKSNALKWEVSPDSNFITLVNSGTIQADTSHDFCVKTDVTGLKPGMHYYYRFKNSEGKSSPVGIASTLPATDVQQFKLAVVSCSSIWAGFFNAYKIIAHRPDIDYVVHLGDYVYDYPDDRQLKRMPDKPVKDCAGLEDWRERHSYYLLDPDLREARRCKTWIATWDNHDTDVEAPGKTEEAIQAFYEYLPIRMPDTLHPERIYRTFPFGQLADLHMIDMQLFRGKETFAEGKQSVLGNAQDFWLKEKLSGATSTWQLIGNQEMMTDWLSSKTVYKLTKRGNGKVFDTGNWNGFPEDRQRLYDLLAEKKLNTVVLTGDVHMSFRDEHDRHPKDNKRYNKRTATGAVG